MSESEELRAENARLSARVSELEAQLDQAPIDRPSLYRMTDFAPWGAMVVDLEGRLDYANPAFQRWLSRPVPATQELAAEVVAPALLAVLQPAIAAALAGELRVSEHRLRDIAGEQRDVRLVVAPRGGGERGVTGTVTSLYDLTETQALDRSVRENEARLNHLNAVTPAVLYIFDVLTGLPIWAGGRVGQILTMSIEELAQRGADTAGDLVQPDDRAVLADRIRFLASQPDGEVAEAEFRLRRPDGTYRWILDRAVVFERDAEGRITKTLSAAIDIDERKRAEEHRTLLINELNHRVKNTLASVQSIARQTLRAGRPPEQTIELFTARLVALSAAHDVLTRENWEGAGLREIVRGALSPFTEGEPRIDVEGPDVRLSARAAVGLAMALHELATNAMKYGSLSVEAGRVHLAWRVRRGDGRAWLRLEWREADGPRVAPPTHAGFGTRLLTQGLRTELDGVTELDFAPTGLVCHITAPLETVPALETA